MEEDCRSSSLQADTKLLVGQHSLNAGAAKELRIGDHNDRPQLTVLLVVVIKVM